MNTLKPVSATNLPQTLLGIVSYFANANTAHEFLVKMRWSDGVTCPHCEQNGVTCQDVSELRGARKLWRCKNCKKQFSVKVGTIFEDSPLSLSKWLPAFWLILNAKNGISSCEIARALGVTQKTAWFMLHRIRYSVEMGNFNGLLIGEVEADETFIGGKERFKHEDKKLKRGRGTVGKTAVMGLLERGGKVKAAVIPDTSSSTLHGQIRQNVTMGATI